MTAGMPETVIFDLDGTLVDTAPDLTAALNEVMRQEGLAPVSPEGVRRMVGRGARVLIELAMEAAGRPAPADRLDGLVAAFISHYRDNIARDSRPFDGVNDCLVRLTARGHRLGVCTNKPEELTLKLLDALDLRRHFPVILGADSRPWRKPDPRHLTDTIAGLGGKPASAVLVGDSDTDLKTARAASVPVILVTFGYTVTPAHELGGDALISHFSELDAALAKIARL